MSFFIKRFLFKELGLDEILNEINREMFDEGAEALSLIFPRKPPMINSKAELVSLVRQLGIDVEIKESNAPIDDRRKAAAIAANMTPLNVENGLDILWQIAMKFRGSKVGSDKVS